VPDDVAYFNTASLAPQLQAVRRAGETALGRRGRPWMISAADWFVEVERLRSLFGRLIGSSSEGVAIVPATSYGFAVAARNLPLRPGQRVLVLEEEYPSGIYTWRAAAGRSSAEIVTVAREPGQTWTDAVLAALDERVAIVSVPNVHWTDGALIDLAPIAARSREVGARLVIDGSQSVGASPLNVEELRPDFLVTVGYKWLLGPLSVGYLYVAEEHREGRAARGELDSARGIRGLRAAGGLSQRVSARRTTLRRRSAHKIRVAADGDRGAGTDRRLAGTAGVRDPRRANLCDRS